MSIHVLPAATDSNDSQSLRIYSTFRQYQSDEEESTTRDLGICEEFSLIQQQFSIYEFECRKNYKSWGSCDKGDMMTSKEYFLVWEWFKDTLNTVDKEQESAEKTLVYYCLVNNVFETHKESSRFFERMKLSHDDQIVSFVQFISVLTDSSIEQSVKLRQHIKDKKRCRRKKVSATEEEGGAAQSTSDPAFHLPHIAPDGKKKNVTSVSSHDKRSRRSSTAALSSSSTPNTTSNTPARRNSSYTTPLHPVGRLQSIGRVFHRQLSRLTLSSSASEDVDVVRIDSSEEDVKHVNSKKKKKEKRKKSTAKADIKVTQPKDDSFDVFGNIDTNATGPPVIMAATKHAQLQERKGNSVLTNIGLNVRRQLNRLASLGNDDNKK